MKIDNTRSKRAANSPAGGAMQKKGHKARNCQYGGTAVELDNESNVKGTVKKTKVEEVPTEVCLVPVVCFTEEP